MYCFCVFIILIIILILILRITFLVYSEIILASRLQVLDSKKQLFDDYQNISMAPTFLLRENNRKVHYRISNSTTKYSGNASNTSNNLIIYLHGYGAHSNNPSVKFLSTKLNNVGINMVSLDMIGHGYSDGINGYIPDYQYLINDVLALLELLYKTEYITKNTKLYLMGHSLGGSVMILVSHILSSKTEHPCKTNYKGVILLAPFISDEYQVNPIIRGLINIIIKCNPNWRIPRWIIDETRFNKYIWNDAKYLEYSNHSCYGKNIQFGTLSSILELGNVIHSNSNNSSNEYNFPMCLIYDKDEDIVITPKQINKIINYNKSNKKQIYHIKNGRHDILANKPEVVSNIILKFILSNYTD